MDFSRLRHLFGSGSSPAQAGNGRNEALDYYCNNFKDFLDKAGYEVAHSSDYQYYRMRSPSLHRLRLSKIMLRHFNNAARWARDGEPGTENLLKGLSEGLNGYVQPDDRIVCLPDEEGLVERMAKQAGFDAARLRTMGLTDQHLYAYVLIHEGSHITGNNVTWQDSNFTRGEFHTHATGLARFLQAGEFRADDPVPKFITAFFSSYTLGGALKAGVDDYAYSWVDRAYDWITANWDAREKFWDEEKGVFLPHVYEKFDYFGDSKKTEAASRPFSLALKGLQSYLKIGVNDPVNAAASRFAGIAAKKNSSRAKDAAYILKRYQAALRILSPYTLEGSALEKDCRTYLPRDELHFAPRR